MGAQELEDMEANWWGAGVKRLGGSVKGWQRSLHAVVLGSGILAEEELG